MKSLFALFLSSLAIGLTAAPPPPAPGREAWTFRQELAAREPYRAHFTRAAQAGECDLAGGVRVVDNYGVAGDLATATADLGDFLADVKLAGGAVPLTLVRRDLGTHEAYAMEVTSSGVTLAAGDDDGLRRAVCYFEDQVLAAAAPALPIGRTTRTPWLRHRLSRCFFGPIKRPPFNRDELMDDIDYYPAAYLNRLAHEGVNGLWLTVEFRDLVGTSFTTAREGAARRLKKLRETARKCLKYGIRTWIFAIEPHAVEAEDPFFKAHPEAFSQRAWGVRVMCASHPVTRQYLVESLANIFAAVPELGGLMTISHGERATSCFSSVNPCVERPIACPACSKVAPWQLHVNIQGAMLEGMRKVNPKAELLSWFYQPYVQPFRAAWVYEAAKHLPEGVTLLYNFESGAIREQVGRYRNGGDYWLSFTGPAEPFRHVAESARAAGMPFGAKIQVGNSHEDATVPFVPVPGLLYRKYAEMKKAGCSAVLQCWYFGNYPGVMNKAAGELAFEEFRESETAFLERLARPDWGDDAPEMAALWRRLSDAYAEYPLSNDMQYYGPFHAGVAWPLLADIEMKPLGRTWKPEDPPSGDTIGECLENHTLDEALILAEKMARGAAEAGDPARLEKKYADNRARLLDLGVLKTLQVQFASAANIFAFYRNRAEAVQASRLCGDAARARAAVARMRELVAAESALVRTLLPYVRRDSRLGFHSEAEQHQFFPAKLEWRLDELEKTDKRLVEIYALLAEGKAYPESDFERTAPKYTMGSGWQEAKDLAFAVERKVSGDLTIRVRRKGLGSFTIHTADRAGTTFVKSLTVTADGLPAASAWKNVVTPEHAARVATTRTKEGYEAVVTLSACAWGGEDAREPAWLRIESGSKPCWPDVAPGPQRLNLGAVHVNTFGRLVR